MLRKPNRTSVATEVMEEADRRRAGLLPVVAATPPKKRSVWAGSSGACKGTTHISDSVQRPAVRRDGADSFVPVAEGEDEGVEDVPGSSFAIPHTGHRPRSSFDHFSTGFGGGVAETPSKPGTAETQMAAAIVDSPTAVRHGPPAALGRRENVMMGETPPVPYPFASDITATSIVLFGCVFIVLNEPCRLPSPLSGMLNVCGEAFACVHSHSDMPCIYLSHEIYAPERS